MAQFMLKASEQDYQAKIDMLTECLNQMNDLKGKMWAHLGTINEFMGEQDSNFEKTKELVQEKIEMLAVAIVETENRRAAVQEVLTAVTGLSGKVASTLTNVIDATKETIVTATRIAKAVDGFIV